MYSLKNTKKKSRGYNLNNKVLLFRQKRKR